MIGWRSTRLKHLAVAPIRNGLGEAGAFDEPGWPRYIRTTDIGGPRTLRKDTFASLPPNTAAKAVLRRNDIVMTAAGATIGKSLLYDSDNPACYAGYLVCFRPKLEVDSRFVSYWTESKPYWSQIEAGKVVSTIENFSASKYQNLVLSVPAFRRQRAIADFLDTETARIDALITKKLYLTELLRSRLVGARQECYQRAAINYGVVPVRRVVTCLDARRIPLNREERSSRPGGYPYWGAGSIVDWIDDYLFDETLVLLGEDGAPFFDTRRDVSFVVDTPVWVNNHVHVLRPRTGVDPQWLCQMLNTVDFSLWITGSTRDKLTQDEMTQILVPAAPEEIQRQWAEALLRMAHHVDHVSELLRRQVKIVREHRQTLITAAVTGELDIPGAAA